MSATPKQIEANRRNAQKSTGPKTPQAKDPVLAGNSGDEQSEPNLMKGPTPMLNSLSRIQIRQAKQDRMPAPNRRIFSICNPNPNVLLLADTSVRQQASSRGGQECPPRTKRQGLRRLERSREVTFCLDQTTPCLDRSTRRRPFVRGTYPMCPSLDRAGRVPAAHQMRYSPPTT